MNFRRNRQKTRKEGKKTYDNKISEKVWEF